MLFSIIVDNLKICRVMYNTILGKYLKLETQMKREKQYKVNTKKFKASQYCHKRNIYVKKPLSVRWHIIDSTTRIQRDLYSSFLLMNSNASGTKADRKKCLETFDSFKHLHDQKIQQILNEQRMILITNAPVLGYHFNKIPISKHTYLPQLREYNL